MLQLVRIANIEILTLYEVSGDYTSLSIQRRYRQLHCWNFRVQAAMRGAGSDGGAGD
jgi:hypothetical protein